MRHLFPLRTKRRIPQLHQLVRPTQCSNSTYCSGYFTHIDKLAHLVFHIIYCNYKYLHLCKFIRIFKTAIKVYMYIINLSWTRWLENFLQSDQLKTLEKVSQSKYKYMYIYTHICFDDLFLLVLRGYKTYTTDYYFLMKLKYIIKHNPALCFKIYSQQVLTICFLSSPLRKFLLKKKTFVS